MRTWVESGLDAYRYNSSVFEWQMDKEDLVQEFGFPRELLSKWFSTYDIKTYLDSKHFRLYS